MRFSRGASALSLLLLIVTSLLAQDLDNVSISGKITDSNGAPIVGATVVATLIETGAERNVTTNEDGRYLLVNLKPGTYKLKANATGFGTKERTDFPTFSGQAVQFDFQLAPAGVTASATVKAGDEDTPAVDTTRTVVGGTITGREIEELPNNTRSPLDLVLTLGGTSEEQLSVSGLAEDRNQNSSFPPLEQGNFSLSGGVAYSNNLTIDGLDNNDDRSSRERFQPSLESIAEVQVISNQFSAEYGRASGGRINLRTRAGSQHFRGRAFFFFRDARLNSNSWYNNSRNLARLPLTEYDPGFTFSGPVKLPFVHGKPRTFFAVAYEFTNLLDTTFIDTWLPVGTNPRWPLPSPTSTTCPLAAPLTCTDASSGAPVLPYQNSLPTPNQNHIFTARVDHRFSSRNDFTFGFQFGRKKNRRTTGASTTRLDDALQVRNANTEAYNFTDNHVFGAKVVNQVRAQYSVYEPSFQTNDPFGPVVLIGYTNPQTGASGQTLITGNSTSAITGDSTGFPQNRRETRYQIQDSLTTVTGRHTMKFGFDVMNVRSKAIGLGDATGTFNFTGMLNFQNNVLSRFRQNFGTRSDVVNTYTGIFFNDEMKLKSNVTMSYGLRYERETAVSDNDNWGPRFGIAWDPFKKGKGVVRFGAGIFYNRVLLRTVADSIQNAGGNLVSFDTNTIGTSATDPRRTAILAAIAANFPNSFAAVEDIRSMLATVCPTVPSPPAPCTTSTGFLGRVTSTGNPLRTVEPDLKIPESYQFNVGFERELIKGWVFEANYTWNKAVHLWRDINGNAPVLPAGYSNWTDWLITHPFVLSPTRQYTFFLGTPPVFGTPSTYDTSGLHVGSPTGSTPCTTTTANCFVNLNTLNFSSTAPAVAVPGTNNNATGAPMGIARAAIAQFRPDPSVEETSVIHSIGNAFYQGLILELRSRFRKLGGGFSSSFRFVYTLSRTMDDGLNNTANAEVNGDFSREWAPSLQDRRHRIALSGVFQTPGWFGKLRFSPLFRYGSPGRFNLGTGLDRNLDDNSTDRPLFIGNLSDVRWREPGSGSPLSLISQFSLAPIGAPSGSLPRNAGRGPSFYTFDLSLTREWRLTEHMRLRPVAEFDNILNAAVFSYGSAFINFNDLTITSSTTQSTFLVPTRTYRQRQIRLGIRFDF
jgi:hypothetical protein